MDRADVTRRAMRHVASLGVLFVAGALLAPGCHLLAGYDAYTFSPGGVTSDKVDILLVIDNSRGTIMADKQTLFETAIGELVDALLPRVDDMHVGVITTSLGGHGADVCMGIGDPSENDRARLVSRDPNGGTVPTYQQLGFLAWDPTQQKQPPGLDDAATLRAGLEQIVLGTGQTGCGFEATLESWYRFLVDPEPPASIEVKESVAIPTGIDDTLLAQRAAFLRPDSLLIVIVLSDENDCSIMDAGQAYYAAQLTVGPNAFHLLPGRKACESFPNDPCCTSCAVDAPEHCEGHPDECMGPLEPIDDPFALRCFDQKRRFGIDFLYPIDRYVTALTSTTVFDRSGQLHDNPVLAGRHPSLLIYSGVVGVPWHDIARRAPNGLPDLVKGVDGDGNHVGGLQTPKEMRALGTWDVILGDPLRYHDVDPQLPSDPLMIESIDPRMGTNPITGDALVQPSEAVGPQDNPINGHEYSNERRDDLQYACTFRLAMPTECDANNLNCSCSVDANADSPLCQDPATGDYGNKQHFVSAYPAIRHLSLMRAIGDTALLGSICPAESAVPQTQYGYQPTVGALLARIDPLLR